MHPLIIIKNLTETDRKTFLKSVKIEDLANALVWDEFYEEDNFAIIESLMAVMSETETAEFLSFKKKADNELENAKAESKKEKEEDDDDDVFYRSIKKPDYVDATRKSAKTIIFSTLKELLEKGKIKTPEVYTPGLSNKFNSSIILLKNQISSCIEEIQNNRAILGKYVLEEKNKLEPKEIAKNSDDDFSGWADDVNDCDDEKTSEEESLEDEFHIKEYYNISNIESDLIKEIKTTIENFYKKNLIDDKEPNDFIFGDEISLHDDFLEIGDDARRRIYAKLIVEHRDELLETLEKKHVKFSDILFIRDRDVQKFLCEVDQQLLALGLKNASKKLKNKIFQNMSKRQATMLEEDIDFMGPVKKSDVYKAQDEIAKVLNSLEKKGEIVFARVGDDELI